MINVCYDIDKKRWIFKENECSHCHCRSQSNRISHCYQYWVGSLKRNCVSASWVATLILVIRNLLKNCRIQPAVQVAVMAKFKEVRMTALHGKKSLKYIDATVATAVAVAAHIFSFKFSSLFLKFVILKNRYVLYLHFFVQLTKVFELLRKDLL